MSTSPTPAAPAWLPHYEIAGRGPTLLLLEAGIGDAASSTAAAAALEDRYTVIRLDRRGLSRSRDRATDGTLAIHSADALAVLDSVGVKQDLTVFGASIGALIALELVAAAPDRMRTVVVHEPPLETLVPQPDRSRELDEVEAIAATDVVAAIGKMGAIVGSGDVREPDAPVPAPAGDLFTNLTSFFAGDFRAVRDYRPAYNTLRNYSSRICVTGGVHSRSRFEYRCATRLAETLRSEFVEIPVGHSALVDFPRTTADFLSLGLES